MEDRRIELIVLNRNFERIGLVDNADSIIWNKRYYETGEFEIYINAALENANLLKEDYYVMREDDDSIGIIEDIEYNEDEEEGEFLTITGKFAESILGRRIVWKQTNLYGTAEVGLRSLLLDNIISPVDEERKLDVIQLGGLKGYTDRLEAQVTGANIESYIQEVCKKIGMGYRLIFSNKKFYFEFYKGVDRSYNQIVNPYVVFNKNFDSLLSSYYKKTTSKFKNVALIAGEGEGLQRKTSVVGTAAGLSRKELFVDANDISSNEGEIPISEYIRLLVARGEEKLTEHIITNEFDGTIDIKNYKYKEDYDLGDIVTVENEQISLYMNARIIEVTEVYDETGYEITPKFGV